MGGDFGFYGKGFDGYTHYMQAFNRSTKGGGGGQRPPRGGSGCLTLIVAAVVVAFIIFSGVNI
ncbi:MAG: HFLK protein [Oscillospiraceae bacterium]|nr:HFLK protein [Oscillospiraceae bacterium]